MSALVKPLQTFRRSDTNFYFSNYGKAHKYICGVSGHYVSQGHQNRGLKSGFKNSF